MLFRRISYGTGLILSLGLILVVSFVFLSYVNFVTVRTSLRHEISSSSLPLTRENIYSEILQDLMPPLNVAAAMASDSFLVEWAVGGEVEVDRITRYLRTIRDDFGYVTAFYVSSKSSVYYHAEGVLKTISPEDGHDIWFYKFIESGEPYELDVDANQAADNELTIFINWRIEDPAGGLLGVTGVGITMESFSRFLSEQQDKYHRTIYLAAPNGVLQAHSDPSLVEFASMFDTDGLDRITPSLLRIGNKPIDSSYERDGSKVLITSRYMEEFGWFIIVEQKESEILAVPRSNLFRNLIVGLFTSIIVLAASLFTVNYFQKRLRLMATTDELTGLANRREFEAELNRYAYRVERYDTPVSIIIIDIDRFKDVNDTSGHLAGDQVIKEITAVMNNTVRDADVLARWGGDEFILLTECTLEQAVQTADRIRVAVADSGIGTALGLRTGITLSCGVTEFAKGNSAEDVIRRADEALYVSKSAGRNTVSSRPAKETSV